MAKEDMDMQITRPRFDWQWNLNTIVILAGFAGGLVTWGYTFAEMRNTQDNNVKTISALDTRVSANEVAMRRIDNHEIRITSIEKQMADSSSTMREVQATLNKLAADMQTANAILSRIEAAQSREDAHSPYPP